ncbi:MAG: hypothetical protein GQ534_03075 [Candidatus Delongbacteria bacterium]|nr:hypothetical protein [Candidatus Delongbacteria bacterium]
MSIHAKVVIRSTKGTAYIIDIIKEFCTQDSDWIYDTERSYIYSKHLEMTMNSKACVLINSSITMSPGFDFCESKDGEVYLANIVLKKGGFDIPEYNDHAKLFYEIFKKWNKKNRNGINISISKTDLELEDIITAKIPRGLFQFYLNQNPLSNHPTDIYFLDRFICSVYSLPRTKINLEHLKEYLLSKRKWAEFNTDWCINRIETGLEILKVYKKG